MEPQYHPAQIEPEAQAAWESQNAFKACENVSQEKYYCLAMFPYPSGTLHMGHVRNYTLADVIARQQRMLGKNVLHPMGWDAFGLPAENAAMKHGVPPAEWTTKNIAHMRTQLQRLGLAIDWRRELTTTDPDYYRWEQWFFLRLYKKGLVYRKMAAVNWDPVDQTILANEQVVNGRGWRSGAVVERREIPQWFLKITAYADELLESLDQLPGWPEEVKAMQRNWIGKATGVEVQFPLDLQRNPAKAGPRDPGRGEASSPGKGVPALQGSVAGSLSIFTTRPDTLFGVSFIAVAPQHPLAIDAATKDPEIAAFLETCRHTKVAEADMATLEKNGVPLPCKALHPLTQEALPVWVANYVLMDYGTGAVMAVPAHDARDFEFASRFGLPIKPVIQRPDGQAHDFGAAALTVPGTLIDSGPFSGQDSKTGGDAIMAALEEKGLGTRQVHYRLRDWSVSRQRYWGTPIPFIHCKECGTVPVPDDALPVRLPENLMPTGSGSPLKACAEFIHITCPACGKPAERETDTFDTFLESSWYYARFTCKKQDRAMLDSRANYWLPVDQYIGGIEHAVMHLLYARFIHKALRDEGLVNCDEPFRQLLTQGMVLKDGSKMSKSKGNTVAPEPFFEKYGADTARLFVMFAAPPEQSLEWSDSGAEGCFRFLKKVWGFAYAQRELITQCNAKEPPDESALPKAANPKQRATLHTLYRLLEQVQADYARLQFNTVVSGCMKLLNLLAGLPPAAKGEENVSRWITCHGFSILLRMLSPIAPHLTHHLWQELHYAGPLCKAPWPKSHASACRMETESLVVQVNGKRRAEVTVPASASPADIERIALEDPKVQQAMAGQAVRKVIVVPRRLINVVTIPHAHSLSQA